MVGQRSSQGGSDALSSARTNTPQLLPAKVKLELEKNRTIVFLNSKVEELTRKLKLSHEDLFAAERKVAELKQEYREISTDLPIKYKHLLIQHTHLRDKAAEYFAQHSRRQYVLLPFRAWEEYAKTRRRRAHLVCFNEGRRVRYTLQGSFAVWRGLVGQRKRAEGWNGAQISKKVFKAWFGLAARSMLLRAKLAKFSEEYAPFYLKLFTRNVFLHWFWFSSHKKALVAKERSVVERIRGKELRKTYSSWKSWTKKCKATKGLLKKVLFQRTGTRALRGWSDYVVQKRTRSLKLVRAANSKARFTIMNIMSAWAWLARYSRKMHRVSTTFHFRLECRRERSILSAWLSLVRLRKAGEGLLDILRSKSRKRRAFLVLQAWSKMCHIRRRVEIFMGKAATGKIQSCFTVWKQTKDTLVYSRRLAHERYRQKEVRAVYKLFCRWRVHLLSNSRNLLIKKLESFEEGLAEIVAPHAVSPMKMARQAQAGTSKAASQGKEISVVEPYQWHRFSKGYLINRASHSAAFIVRRDANASPMQTQQGQYLIFGGHDLESRQNIFTIVNINVHMGESGDLRFKAEVCFEGDTSIDGPCPRSDHCMCELGQNSVLVFGGFDGTKELGDVYQVTWEDENFPEITCKRLVSNLDSPVRRSHHTVCTYTDKLDEIDKFIMFGGYSKKNGGLMNDLWTFDLETNAWELLEATGDIPCPRRDHSSTIINSTEMLVFGGFDGSANLSDCYTLNLLTLRWTKMELKGELPGARRQHTIVQMDKDNVVICGGFGGSQVLQDIHVLNVSSLQCRPIGAIIEGGRCLHSCASLGSNLLLFGGVSNEGEAVNDLLLLEHLGSSNSAYLSSQAKSLQDKIFELEKDLDSEIASKDSYRIQHVKEKTRNTFLENSLKSAIEQQKEGAKTYKILKGKLSKHKQEEARLRQVLRETRHSLDAKKKELVESKKLLSSSVKHYDVKIAELSYDNAHLSDQLVEAKYRIGTQESMYKDQALSLQKMSQTLQASSKHISMQQKEKEVLDLELAENKSQVNFLEKTTLSLEGKLEQEAAKSAELEKRVEALQAQKKSLEETVDTLKRDERRRVVLEASKSPRDAATQVSERENQNPSSKSTQSLTFNELANQVKAQTLAEDKAAREKAKKANENLELDLRTELERMIAEMYTLGATNKSLGDQLEYSNGKNESLLKSLSAVEDENKFLQANLKAVKEMQKEAYAEVAKVQSAAEAEIKKLKSEITQLRNDRYLSLA